MKIALVDSGIGLLAAAAALRRLRPDTDLVLSCDPEGMPWGPRTPEEITEHALACALAAARLEPDALVVACNTATVHALPALRARLEPSIPVIGTVPAVKPAGTHAGPVAVWATPATTGSPYQRRLIAEFAGGVPVTEVACPGLADALERADRTAVVAAVARAAATTPPGVTGVVLGCTHYELAAGPIRAALRPGGDPAPLTLYGSAEPVAAQVLRRLATVPAPGAPVTGTLEVLLNGRPGTLPAAALAYPEGRSLTAGVPVAAGVPAPAR